MSTSPDITVIIPAYNALPYLHRGLESIVAQTLGVERLEVVVVDDGSTDGTGEALDDWAARYPDLFQVVHAPASGGPAGPRNTGLDLAHGRYVFFLDADDFLGEEALERLLAAAEDNGSDIVLGRMASTTGRAVPASMFRRTEPDVDLFQSRVYWTLAPLKLFRRDLVEDHGLRFPTQFPNCSDQPFTAAAYLRARKISVLSDYDYYYAEVRDDGGHVTSTGSISNRLDVIEAMCDLLAREVPDVDRRAPLVTRHFQVDLARAVRSLRTQPPAAQQALFDRIATVVSAHLSPAVEQRLPAILRVAYHLVGRGLLAELLVVAAFDADPPWDVTVEGDRAFAHLPFFRDPAVPVPDELYDVGGRVSASGTLTSFGCADGALHVAGTAGLRNVAGAVDVELVLRRRGAASREHAVPVPTDADGGFAAAVDLLTLEDGGPLGRGVWDVGVRVSKGGLVRTARLGDDESEVLDPRPSLTWQGVGAGGVLSARAFLARNRRLRVDIGTTKPKVAKSFGRWAATWDGTDLLVSARTKLRIEVPLLLAVGTGAGDVRTYPVQVDGAAISGRIPVADLPEETWSVRLRVGTAPVARSLAVPAKPKLPEVTWRRRLPSMVATPVLPAPGLVLRVSRRGPARVAGALTRRLRRLSGR